MEALRLEKRTRQPDLFRRVSIAVLGSVLVPFFLLVVMAAPLPMQESLSLQHPSTPVPSRVDPW